MKKTIAIIITVFSLSNNIRAQAIETDLRDKLMFGLKAGANYSNVYDSQGEAFDANSKFGIAAGAFLAIPIGKYLGVHPELLFSQKGFQATGKIISYQYDFTRTVSYIDIPILFEFKPSEFITILAGPQYSYLVNQKDAFANSNTTLQVEQEFKNDNVRKNTLCFLGGIDINIKFIVLGLRAGWDIQKNNGDGTSITPRYKNTWYQATIGFRI